jgi:hypothetical protein
VREVLPDKQTLPTGSAPSSALRPYLSHMRNTTSVLSIECGAEAGRSLMLFVSEETPATDDVRGLSPRDSLNRCRRRQGYGVPGKR